MGADLPSGTVTFLFTDIEGSTRLWEAAPDAMRAALERHDAIVRSAVEARAGYVFATGGDGFAAAFARAGDAVAAALSAQEGLRAEAWPDGAALAVRMALHTGDVVERGGDYFGTPVNQAARLMALAHGGQVLCSSVTAGLVNAEVPLIDLGEHHLRDLSAAQHVFQVGAGSFPALRSAEGAGNLPVQLSSFIGRRDDIADIVGMVQGQRLVTLTGLGGVGKTRLALQAAASLEGSFRDGVWVVELASLAEGGEVPAAVAAVLRIAQLPGRGWWGSVCDACRHRQLLLVLDNCEHLLDDIAELAPELLAAAPGVTVLATSREALAITGERLRPVRPLSVEDEAVALFVDRGQAVQPDFALTPENESAVADVCRHLDGMPLAIELAAARVGTMTPSEIASRLDDRFRLLRAGRRTRTDRHQTLRATIDWSYALLDATEQRAFCELAVFPSAFTAEAAQAVVSGDAWDTVDAIDSLVAKSLLTSANQAGTTRFQMLETVRHYAGEQLGSLGGVDELRARHAAWVVRFLEERAGPGLRGPDERAWADEVIANRDDVVAAMDWAAQTGEIGTAMRLAAAVVWHGPVAPELGVSELPLQALAMPQAGGHPLLSDVASAGAYVLVQRGDNEGAIELAERSIAAARPGDAGPVYAREAMSLALLRLGRPAEAVAVNEEALAYAEALDDPWLLLIALSGLVAFYLNQYPDRLDRAAALAAREVQLARGTGNPSMMSAALFSIGFAKMAEGDVAAAIASFEASLASGGFNTSELATMSALGYLGRCYAAVGDVERAVEMVRRAVLASRQTGSKVSLAQALDYGGQALITLGHDGDGVCFIAAVEGGRIAVRAMGGLERQRRADAQAMALARLGEPEYQRAVAEGAALTAETAMQKAVQVLDRISPRSQ